MVATATSTDNGSAQYATLAFQFVSELAAEVSAGRIELPAFPDVATRVRKVLADEHVAAENVARVVGSEAGLAARVMSLANSAALNRTGRSITELKTAINRIGHSNVRTAAVAFAIAQLRRAPELAAISSQLEVMWQQATMVAALSYAIATRTAGVNADEAMLAGLIHNVGKIYVLARARKHPDLFASPDAVQSVIHDWHANVGKAIVENWGFATHIAEAIGNQDDIEYTTTTGPDITDVLVVATLAGSYVGDETADMELNLQGVRPFTRLGLDNAKFHQIMRECVDEIAALRVALGN